MTQFRFTWHHPQAITVERLYPRIITQARQMHIETGDKIFACIVDQYNTPEDRKKDILSGDSACAILQVVPEGADTDRFILVREEQKLRNIAMDPDDDTATAYLCAAAIIGKIGDPNQREKAEAAMQGGLTMLANLTPECNIFLFTISLTSDPVSVIPKVLTNIREKPVS